MKTYVMVANWGIACRTWYEKVEKTTVSFSISYLVIQYIGGLMNQKMDFSNDVLLPVGSTAVGTDKVINSEIINFS